MISLVCAITHSAALAIALFWRVEFPAFCLALMAWLPIAWTWAPESQRWTWRIWLPCALLFAVLQAMSAIEAVYRFGERYRLVVRLSITTGFFAAAAGIYCWMSLPSHDSGIAQATEFVTYQRVTAAAFLILALALFASFLNWCEFWKRREGRHLLLLTVLTLTWAVPAIMPKESSFDWWQAVSAAVIWCRCGVLILWIAVVPQYVPTTRSTVLRLKLPGSPELQ